MEVSLGTGLGVYDVLAHICRSPLEALRQFIENGADAIEIAAEPQGRILVHLAQADGAEPELWVEDNGFGMTPEKMAQVLQNIGHSEKVSMALRGEKGVGILAFALLARELHLCSSPQAGSASACLVLHREGLDLGCGEVLTSCPIHTQARRGTTAYLIGILPEATAILTGKRLKEFMGREFAPDLREKKYSLALEVDGHWEPVEPQRLHGVGVLAESLPLRSGGVAVMEIRLLPTETSQTGITVYGRGGVRICALSSLEPLEGSPWLDRRLEGYIRCDRIKRTADKTAIVQDKTYTELVDALQSAATRLRKAIAQVAQEHMERRLDRVTRRVDQLVERFLKHVEEGAPLRTFVPASTYGDGRRVHQARAAALRHSTGPRRKFEPAHFRIAPAVGATQPDWQSSSNGDVEVVDVNQGHPDFMEAGQDDARCSRYLFSLWAKEHLLSEYGSDSRKVAEVLVSWLNKVDPLLTRSGKG